MIYLICILSLIAVAFWGAVRKDKFDCERKFYSRQLNKTFKASCGTWCKITDKVD